MRITALAVVVAVAVASKVDNAPQVDLSVPMPGKEDAAQGQCQSWWAPMIIETNSNTTLLYGACKPACPNRGKPGFS